MTSAKLVGRCGFIAGSVMMLALAAVPVSAQGLPNGSYLQSCRNVAVHGDRLLADCRRTDGRWARTALQNVDRCVGDIGNMNGQLACNHTGGNNRLSRDGDNRAWPGTGMAMSIETMGQAGVAHLIIGDTGAIGPAAGINPAMDGN